MMRTEPEEYRKYAGLPDRRDTLGGDRQKSEMVYGCSQAAEALQARIFPVSGNPAGLNMMGLRRRARTDDCSFVILTATVYPGRHPAPPCGSGCPLPVSRIRMGHDCIHPCVHPDIRQEEGSFPAFRSEPVEMEARLEAKALISWMGRNSGRNDGRISGTGFSVILCQ